MSRDGPRLAAPGQPSESQAMMAPEPPYVLLREGVAFSVECTPVDKLTATQQAMDAGCFRNAFCYDRSGRLWRIRDASLMRPPSFANRFMPWRRLAVAVSLDPPAPVPLTEMISRISEILGSGNEFCELLSQRTDLVGLQSRFEACASAAALIEVARKAGE